MLWTLNDIVYIPNTTLLSRDKYDNTEIVVVPVVLATCAVCLQLESKLARSGLTGLDSTECIARVVGVRIFALRQTNAVVVGVEINTFERLNKLTGTSVWIRIYSLLCRNAIPKVVT